MRRRVGPVTEISVFASEISLGNRAGNFSNFSHMNTPARIPGRNIFNCAWLVRSLTGRNVVPRVFWWPFGRFSSRY